jgi:hypothetical protein
VPDAFIYVIGGLAMLRVLQQSLAAAFGGKFTAGAVVCMVVTVTELIPEARFALLGIGAPFWGLVFGIVTSLLLEPQDFRRPAVARPERPVPVSAPPADAKPERPRPPVPAWALEEQRPAPAKATAPVVEAATPATASAPAESPAQSPATSPAQSVPEAETVPMQTPPASDSEAITRKVAAAPASDAPASPEAPEPPTPEEKKEPASPEPPPTKTEKAEAGDVKKPETKSSG